jgi:hypothetical protein
MEVLHLPIGKDKTRIAVTLVKDTAKSVEELAEHEKRTVSAMMAILVEEALNIRNKNKYGFVRGAEYYKNVKGLNHTESEGNK